MNFFFSNSRSSTPLSIIETEDERAARANFQWFLSSLKVPLNQERHPFRVMPVEQEKTDDNFGLGLSLVAMLCRLKVESERKRLFSYIYKGPISNQGKVRLN